MFAALPRVKLGQLLIALFTLLITERSPQLQFPHPFEFPEKMTWEGQLQGNVIVGVWSHCLQLWPGCDFGQFERATCTRHHGS